MEVVLIILLMVLTILVVAIVSVGFYLERKEEERKVEEALRKLEKSVHNGWNDNISLKGEHHE